MVVITAAAIRQGVFARLRTLILANLPTYTYNSGTITYTMVASFPRDNPSFPVVVLNTASIKMIPINLSGDTQDYEVEVQIDFYAKELHGKLAIDTGQDELCASFIANRSAFDTADGLLLGDPFWDDSNISEFTSGNQVLNTGSSMVRFILK